MKNKYGRYGSDPYIKYAPKPTDKEVEEMRNKIVNHLKNQVAKEEKEKHKFQEDSRILNKIRELAKDPKYQSAIYEIEQGLRDWTRAPQKTVKDTNVEPTLEETIAEADKIKVKIEYEEE